MKFILSLSILAFPILCSAAGVRHVDGAAPVRYTSPDIVLNYDVGPLGTLNNTAANDLFLQSINLWNAVATSTINFTRGSDLPSDINETNYQSLIIPQTGGTTAHTSFTDGLNPVIYDTDGKILDDYLGAGQGSNVGGIATSLYGIGSNNYITGHAIINGNPAVSVSLLPYIITHEMGHMIGLDHSQLNITDSNKACVLTGGQYPIMYATPCSQPSALHADDISAISALYPAQNVAATFGEINGTLVDPSSAAKLGANIFVTNTTTNQVYSIVSDYLKQGTGYFSLLVPAGTYTLQASPVIAEFRGLSSVGPYATSAADISFSNPVTAFRFSGATPGSDELIAVSIGQATTVNVVTDGSGTVTTGASMTLSAVAPTVTTTPTTTTPTTVGGSGGGGSLNFLSGLLLLLVGLGKYILISSRLKNSFNVYG